MPTATVPLCAYSIFSNSAVCRTAVRAYASAGSALDAGHRCALGGVQRAVGAVLDVDAREARREPRPGVVPPGRRHARCWWVERVSGWAGMERVSRLDAPVPAYEAASKARTVLRIVAKRILVIQTEINRG